MKAFPLKTAGAALLLAALLSSGAMPAQAVPGCTWPVQNSGIGLTCDRPQFTITQAYPATVGTPVLLSGSGFEPGEQVSVVDRDGVYSLSAVAGTDGVFTTNWAVPDFSPTFMPMISATGAVSQYETEAFQVYQDRAVIFTAVNGDLSGWYPGEELVITVGGEPRPSQYASAAGSSDSFMNITGPSGTTIEVVGKQSGGFFSRLAFGPTNGNVRPFMPEPVEVPAEPVLELPAEPVLEALVVVELPAEPAPVVSVPAPSRPQPQAAVAAREAEGALLASGVPALALLAGAAGISAASVVSFLALRRLRAKNNGQ